MVICLERGAYLHIAQLVPLPLTVSCFSEIQIGFTFLVPAAPGSPGQMAIIRVCVCLSISMSVFTKFIVRVTYGHGSLHWHYHHMLYTSGFMNDVFICTYGQE